MATVHVSAEKEISGTADVVYGYIADMSVHPKFLPSAFSNFRVERQDGEPITCFDVTAGGRTRAYRMRVAEPEPGRVLTESDINSSLVTTFTVSPVGSASSVQISTDWQGAGGIGGFFERLFAPKAMRKIYNEELDRLDTYVKSHSG